VFSLQTAGIPHANWGSSLSQNRGNCGETVCCGFITAPHSFLTLICARSAHRFPTDRSQETTLRTQDAAGRTPCYRASTPEPLGHGGTRAYFTDAQLGRNSCHLRCAAAQRRQLLPARTVAAPKATQGCMHSHNTDGRSVRGNRGDSRDAHLRGRDHAEPAGICGSSIPADAPICTTTASSAAGRCTNQPRLTSS
jgi:hypothetical protein